MAHDRGSGLELLAGKILKAGVNIPPFWQEEWLGVTELLGTYPYYSNCRGFVDWRGMGRYREGTRNVELQGVLLPIELN